MVRFVVRATEDPAAGAVMVGRGWACTFTIVGVPLRV
jgi:hypothetical protein